MIDLSGRDVSGHGATLTGPHIRQTTLERPFAYMPVNGAWITPSGVS